MGAAAHSFVSVLTRAEVTIADALAAAAKITDKDALDYSQEAAVTALEDIVAFTRKWLNAPEVKLQSSLLGYPVLADAATQRALASVVSRLNDCGKLMGSGALRIAGTLERLAREKNPRDAALAGSQATTVARRLKLEIQRARPKPRRGQTQ